MRDYKRELEMLFEKANHEFLCKNMMLFETRVSERTLCGALMIELHEELKNTRFKNYFVDVEYNRNIGGAIKTLKKTIRGMDEEIVTINCDLIVHSRGQNVYRDNLIAIEMKKSTGRIEHKESDKNRLKCLTKRPDQDVWRYSGKALPTHVCGYGLGIYYEINFRSNIISIEYYAEGNCYKKYSIVINNWDVNVISRSDVYVRKYDGTENQ